jgi:hypothetical protein
MRTRRTYYATAAATVAGITCLATGVIGGQLGLAVLGGVSVILSAATLLFEKSRSAPVGGGGNGVRRERTRALTWFVVCSPVLNCGGLFLGFWYRTGAAWIVCGICLVGGFAVLVWLARRAKHGPEIAKPQ